MMSTVPHSPLARRPLAAAPNPAGPPVPTCPPRVSEVNTGVGGVILGFPDRFCARFESAPGEREGRRPHPAMRTCWNSTPWKPGRPFSEPPPVLAPGDNRGNLFQRISCTYPTLVDGAKWWIELQPSWSSKPEWNTAIELPSKVVRGSVPVLVQKSEMIAMSQRLSEASSFARPTCVG